MAELAISVHPGSSVAERTLQFSSWLPYVLRRHGLGSAGTWNSAVSEECSVEAPEGADSLEGQLLFQREATTFQ